MTKPVLEKGSVFLFDRTKISLRVFLFLKVHTKMAKKVVKKSHFITVWNNLYKKIAIMTQGGYNQNRRKENFRRPVKSHNRI